MLGVLPVDNFNVRLRVAVAVVFVFNHERVAPPLSEDLGVLPQLVLFPFGDPAFDQHVLWVLLMVSAFVYIIDGGGLAVLANLTLSHS